MPVDDDFAKQMALHCSFEHFEKNADMMFLEEASRVLKKGGRLCILPLYLFDTYAIETNPYFMPAGGIAFETDAKLYCVKDKRAIHCRFYDIPHLTNRIKNNLNDLHLTIYVLQNETEIDPSCYVKFVGLFTKQ